MKERPFLNYNRPIFDEREIGAVARTLEKGWLSGGAETLCFEDELAAWWGVKHAVSVNSGSSANFVALQALNLPKGSEVITPAGGAFPTTVSPMAYHGLRPVFVDVDLENMCIDIGQIEAAIGPEARAIMFAHTLGFMPQMDGLMNIAKKHDLFVIEDSCDAMGSKQSGKMAGTFGDLATVSFYPAHTMTTGGEGGAILTNNSKLDWECRSIRDWGRDCWCRMDRPAPACRNRFGNPPFDHRYYYTRIGGNWKMTEMQASFGREQLMRVDDFIFLRRRNYDILADALGTKRCGEIAPFAYPILHEGKERIMAELNDRRVETRTLFAGNILAHPAYENMDCRVVGKLPNSQRILQEAFFVGVGPHLSEEDMLYIAEQLKEVL